MVTSEELYELWSGDAELRDTLAQSLDPRGTEWLFELFASLGPRAGEVLVDVGCRDASHTIRLARDHGLRCHAVDPLPLHVERARGEVDAAAVDVEVRQAAIEELPLADASVDWIWCRDVLVHADVRRGLAECARVLRDGGRMIAYITVATERLEPRERALLVDAAAVVPESFDARSVEAAADAAGLAPVDVHRLGSEWRERMLEDGAWDANATLLSLARLHRRRSELAERFGEAAVAAREGGDLWGIYQLLGKTCPTVYVWEKRG
jgi:SAM-dependent methyltransferase